MRAIDADALIADLEHDIAIDQDCLDCEELTDINRKHIQHDKDCKQNAINFVMHTPSIEERKTQWIPCSLELPEETGKYLVTVKNGNVYAGTYDGYSKRFQCEAIAWMPLPLPYQGEGEEE